jgi:hydroxymethylpyrimidine pyrophosphatase-like HAD family hydrolase
VELRREALELVQSVYESLPEIGIQVNTFDKIYFSRENEAMRIFREQTGSPNITRDFDKVSEPIAKIVFGDTSNDNILALERLLLSHPRADEFGFVRSDDILYEILPKGSSKGGVLPEIAKNAGVDIKRVIAVGDYNNDVTMLREAGLGIAVANATPEALGAADLVTVSNEDDAIAKIIEDVEKGTIKV